MYIINGQLQPRHSNTTSYGTRDVVNQIAESVRLATRDAAAAAANAAPTAASLAAAQDALAAVRTALPMIEQNIAAAERQQEADELRRAAQEAQEVALQQQVTQEAVRAQEAVAAAEATRAQQIEATRRANEAAQTNAAAAEAARAQEALAEATRRAAAARQQQQAARAEAALAAEAEEAQRRSNAARAAAAANAALAAAAEPGAVALVPPGPGAVAPGAVVPQSQIVKGVLYDLSKLNFNLGGLISLHELQRFLKQKSFRFHPNKTVRLPPNQALEQTAQFRLITELRDWLNKSKVNKTTKFGTLSELLRQVIKNATLEEQQHLVQTLGIKNAQVQQRQQLRLTNVKPLSQALSNAAPPLQPPAAAAQLQLQPPAAAQLAAPFAPPPRPLQPQGAAAQLQPPAAAQLQPQPPPRGAPAQEAAAAAEAARAAAAAAVPLGAPPQQLGPNVAARAQAAAPAAQAQAAANAEARAAQAQAAAEAQARAAAEAQAQAAAEAQAQARAARVAAKAAQRNKAAAKKENNVAAATKNVNITNPNTTIDRLREIIKNSSFNVELKTNAARKLISKLSESPLECKMNGKYTDKIKTSEIDITNTKSLQILYCLNTLYIAVNNSSIQQKTKNDTIKAIITQFTKYANKVNKIESFNSLLTRHLNNILKGIIQGIITQKKQAAERKSEREKLQREKAEKAEEAARAAAAEEAAAEEANKQRQEEAARAAQANAPAATADVFPAAPPAPRSPPQSGSDKEVKKILTGIGSPVGSTQSLQNLLGNWGQRARAGWLQVSSRFSGPGMKLPSGGGGEDIPSEHAMLQRFGQIIYLKYDTFYQESKKNREELKKPLLEIIKNLQLWSLDSKKREFIQKYLNEKTIQNTLGPLDSASLEINNDMFKNIMLLFFDNPQSNLVEKSQIAFIIIMKNIGYCSKIGTEDAIELPQFARNINYLYEKPHPSIQEVIGIIFFYNCIKKGEYNVVQKANGVCPGPKMINYEDEKYLSCLLHAASHKSKIGYILIDILMMNYSKKIKEYKNAKNAKNAQVTLVQNNLFIRTTSFIKEIIEKYKLKEYFEKSMYAPVYNYLYTTNQKDLGNLEVKKSVGNNCPPGYNNTTGPYVSKSEQSGGSNIKQTLLVKLSKINHNNDIKDIASKLLNTKSRSVKNITVLTDYVKTTTSTQDRQLKKLVVNVLRHITTDPNANGKNWLFSYYLMTGQFSNAEKNYPTSNKILGLNALKDCIRSGVQCLHKKNTTNNPELLSIKRIIKKYNRRNSLKN